MYSTETQAKNGFKTFIITLAVSSILFGGIYYLLTGFTENVDIENTKVSASTQEDSNMEYSESLAYNKAEVQGTTTSVFEDINSTPVTNKPSYVLAGATESSESTVPSTGSESVISLALTVIAFSSALFFIAFGPRKYALQSFEQDMISDDKIDY